MTGGTQRERRAQQRLGVAMLVLPALAFFVFVLWPALQAFFVAAHSWTGFSPTATFVGFENFDALLHDARFGRSVINTLTYSLFAGVSHFVLAFVFAAALSSERFRWRRFFQTWIVFPAFLSIVGVGVLWARIYDMHDGLLNGVLGLVGLGKIDWLSDRLGMASLVVASTWAGVGSQVLLLMAGIHRIPREYYEAARIDGASELQAFRFLTLPLLKEVTLVAASLWIIGSLQVFGLVQTLTGASPPDSLETISTYQYAVSFNARDNVYLMGRGTAMAVVLSALVGLLLGALHLCMGRAKVEY